MTAAESDRLDRLRLARTEGVGPITFRRLLSRFSSAAEALDALPGLALAGGRATPPRIPRPAEMQREMAATGKRGATLLLLGDPSYPPALAATDDAPPVLTVLGDPAVLSRRTVALVGARNASANGQRVAELLAADLAGRGIVVVSGLARGIDAAAHTGALHAGHTVAAIAGGLDMPYPPENADLQTPGRRARGRGDGGTLGHRAAKPALPQAQPHHRRPVARHRGGGGGAALRQPDHRPHGAGRAPGDLRRAGLAARPALPRFQRPDPAGRPPDRDGGGRAAAPAASAGSDPAPNGFSEPGPPPLAPPEDPRVVRGRVLQLLGPSPSAVDDLVRRCQFSASAVMAALLELELSGRIEMLPGHRVSLLEDEFPGRPMPS